MLSWSKKLCLQDNIVDTYWCIVLLLWYKNIASTCLAELLRGCRMEKVGLHTQSLVQNVLWMSSHVIYLSTQFQWASPHFFCWVEDWSDTALGLSLEHFLSTQVLLEYYMLFGVFLDTQTICVCAINVNLPLSKFLWQWPREWYYGVYGVLQVNRYMLYRAVQKMPWPGYCSLGITNA